MITIGLVGAKGAGKTTAFNFINRKYPGALEITLAGYLKDVCARVFNVERDYFDSHEFKEADLESPAYITTNDLLEIYTAYGLEKSVSNNLHIRPHLGKVLHTPRQIAQYVGTEILRAVQESVHCDVAYQRAENHDGLAVITDIRFPNEFDYFKERSSQFVPLYIKNTAAETNAAGDTHASEAYLFDLAKKSVKVSNESTLEAFEKEVYKHMQENVRL